jgi:hypothetical protein
MMMYRSLVVGLLGAIALLVATGPGSAPDVVAPPAAAASFEAPRNDASVVDVSYGRAGLDLMPLLGLAPGERIASLDGAPADSAALTIQWYAARPGGYLDVGVLDAGGDERRILVLVHP